MLLPMFLSAAALAGDPCPIDVEVSSVSPSWRDVAADLAALQTRRTWLGLTYGPRGDAVVVRRTVPGSPAAVLEAGERIVSVDGQPVASKADVSAALDRATASVRLGLDGKQGAREVTLEPAPVDPLFLAIVQALEDTDCRSVRVRALDAGQAAVVEAHAFTAERGFRCDDAHVALAPHVEVGSLLVVRGGRRVLLVAPGSGTRCVAVADVDGPGLAAESLKALVEPVLAPYVQDRHDNP